MRAASASISIATWLHNLRKLPVAASTVDKLDLALDGDSTVDLVVLPRDIKEITASETDITTCALTASLMPFSAAIRLRLTARGGDESVPVGASVVSQVASAVDQGDASSPRHCVDPNDSQGSGTVMAPAAPRQLVPQTTISDTEGVTDPDALDGSPAPRAHESS